MTRTRPLALCAVAAVAITTLLLVTGAGPVTNGDPSMSIADADTAKPSQSNNPAAGASNAFGLDLYRKLAGNKPDGNLFISPYSISVALAMTAEGARGETEAEMARVLHFPKGTSKRERAITTVHEGNKDLRERFRTAAGTNDPKVRKRIGELREKLDDANRETKSLQHERKWTEADRAQEKANAIADELNKLLAEIDRFDLRIANALWVEQHFHLEPAYIKTIDRYYESGAVTPMDFVNHAEDSRQKINGWVENHTEKRIKDLIAKGNIGPDTRLVITNAVYFLGQWAEPFDKKMTRDEDFTLADDSKVKTHLMHDYRRDQVPYAAFNGDGSFFDTPREVPVDEASRPPTYPDDGFTMIELSYKGDELSMVILAPRTPAGLPALEQMLTSENLASWLTHMDARRVNIAVPKFKLESKFDLGSTLKAMGMERAFVNPADPNGAEFDGMSDSPDPAKRLYIGEVIHKAFVDVNEEGTEAAAATAVVMRAGAAAPHRETIPFIPEFRADRPFVFLIRDTKTGVVLFIGRMVNPNA